LAACDEGALGPPDMPGALPPPPSGEPGVPSWAVALRGLPRGRLAATCVRGVVVPPSTRETSGTDRLS